MTMDVHSLEATRLHEQARLDSLKSAVERNEWGQFATPPALALDMAKYVRDLWTSRTDKIRFFDPAIGTGAFYSALLRAFPKGVIQSALGIELDSVFVSAARGLWERTGLSVIKGDFTRSPVAIESQRPNLILTNPPYVRHHHIDPGDKVRLKTLVAEKLGYNISGLAGLYCYFLLLAHEWLAEDGIGVWLIPSEFMDVNYGTTLKRYLAERVTLLHIHRFDPTDLQFGDALVSSAVVVFQKSGHRKNHRTIFSYGGSLLKPKCQRSISLEVLAHTRKWTSLPDASRNELEEAKGEGPVLGAIFATKRGIATGANNFFILPRDKARSLRIPHDFLKPILPSPRHLKTLVIEADRDGYPVLEKQLALIDCDLPEHRLRKEYPRFWAYLESGKERGICETYLASNRTPWYKQEHRPPAPFLCTYMGRTTRNGRPFRFLWNRSQATAPNVYLLLYPIGPLKAALKRDPGLAKRVFDLLQEIDLTDLTGEGRVYGGGLHKLEPNELARISARRFAEALGLKIEPPASQQSLPFVDLIQATKSWTKS